MRLAKLFLIGAFALGMSAAVASAQQGLLDAGEPTAETEGAWDYQRSAGPLTPRQIIQQKAQARAEQRMSRMAAQEWYGFSKARPTATSTPFTGLYGGQWQGYTYGRPAAWHASRPIIVITK